MYYLPIYFFRFRFVCWWLLFGCPLWRNKILYINFRAGSGLRLETVEDSKSWWSGWGWFP